MAHFQSVDLPCNRFFVNAEKRITLDHVRQHPFFWKHEKLATEAVTVEENESGEEGTVEWSDSMDVMTC